MLKFCRDRNIDLRLSGVVSLCTALVFLVFLGAILKLDHGKFVYSMDDPYIHLALARNILHGHYGINAGSVSAPSSSILWPFLMAPFAVLPFFEFVPLILNFVLLILSACLIARILRADSMWQGVLATLFLMVALNVFGIAFTGLEHSLQVFLVLMIVFGLQLEEERKPLWFYACVLLLPLIRYEGMAIAVPVLALSFWRGDRVRAVGCFVLILTGVGAFSLFLHSLGLGFLPSSVMAKSMSVGRIVRDNLIAYGFMVPLILMFMASGVREAKTVGLLLLSVTGLHFVFGRNGWLGRYEVYYLAFALLMLMGSTGFRKVGGLKVFIALPFAFFALFRPTYQTPGASLNIASQQVPMAEIVQTLGQSVAVNDLGLVALRGGQRVLDLWGLGSLEALKDRKLHPDDSAWVAELMEKDHVKYAMIFDDWFPNLPASMIKVGELNTFTPKVIAAGTTVSFYAVDPAAAAEFREALVRFKSAHPDNRQYGVKIEGAAGQ